jgi:hypothetical protein
VRLAVFALLIACKPDAPPPAATGSGSATPAVTGSAAPAAGPTIAPAKKESLAPMLPTIPSAKVLKTKSPNEAYALATWCIDEADAIAQITAALERDGWRNVKTRGEAPQIAIAAMKGDVRFSARTGGSDQRCAGTYVTATVMRLGNLDAKLLEDTKLR